MCNLCFPLGMLSTSFFFFFCQYKYLEHLRKISTLTSGITSSKSMTLGRQVTHDVLRRTSASGFLWVFSLSLPSAGPFGWRGRFSLPWGLFCVCYRAAVSTFPTLEKPDSTLEGKKLKIQTADDLLLAKAVLNLGP